MAKEKVTELFGSMVFNEDVMKQRLSATCYRAWKKCVEEGTPLARRVAEGESLPSDDEQAGRYLWTVARLAQAGLEQYEVSNFSRTGYQSRHNLKYWTLGEYAGFGPGAHSDFRGVRYAWARDFEAFLRGDRILSETRRMAPRDREAERLMLPLRLVRGLDMAEERFPSLLPFLGRCEAAGYALRREGAWRLTPRGFLVSNQIIGELLSLLPPQC